MRRGSRRHYGLLALALLALASCAEHGTKAPTQQQATIPGYKVGKPYQIDGVWYYPAVDYNYAETGIASWYGPDFHGLATANGETYDMNALTAAHRTLPMPSMVRVTNLDNGRQIALRVNDRGPFANNRIIDVSRRAAQLLGFEQQGTARVRVEIMDAEPPAGDAGRRRHAPAAADRRRPVRPTPSRRPRSRPPGRHRRRGDAGAAIGNRGCPGRAAGSAYKPGAAQPIIATVTVPVAAGPQPDGKVTVVPVRRTAMFIQAGAFTNLANATRLRTMLTSFGQAQVVPAYVGTQKYLPRPPRPDRHAWPRPMPRWPRSSPPAIRKPA